MTAPRYAQHVSTRNVPQSRPLPGTTQVPNSAGGYAWAVDDWTRLRRFLILGNEGGSYYASEQKLTTENAEAVQRCIASDGPKVVSTVVEVSQGGKAPKNDPALFVLALCFSTGNQATKAAAEAALPKVARIGTHLFHFAAMVQEFRGWGRMTRRAIGNWYNQRTAESTAFQAVKYQARDQWSHRDLLRLTHPQPATPEHGAVYRWIVRGVDGLGARMVERGPKDKKVSTAYGEVARNLLPRIVEAFEEAKSADEAKLVELITNDRLPMEAIPTEKRTAAIYRALAPSAGLTWLFRNLGNLSKHEVLRQGAEITNTICARLVDQEVLKRERVHPIQALMALLTYKSGHGFRGTGEWSVVPDVVDALDEAFYKAFDAVEPAGKRTLLALDVSGSMGGGSVGGCALLTPRTAAAAMAMVTYKTEPNVFVMAFQDRFVPLDISRKKRLDDVVAATDHLLFGGTDCAMPMLWAKRERALVDTFVVYTDSETWAGTVHPSVALQAYRNQFVPDAKLVVVGMVSNGFTIADPNDRGMLDVVGFSSDAPVLINEFSAGRV